MQEIELRFQIELLKQERQPYINTRFILQRRIRAVVGLIEQKILKEEDDPKKPILDELVKIEAWIEQYDEQIAELEAEQSKQVIVNEDARPSPRVLKKSEA